MHDAADGTPQLSFYNLQRQLPQKDSLIVASALCG